VSDEQSTAQSSNDTTVPLVTSMANQAIEELARDAGGAQTAPGVDGGGAATDPDPSGTIDAGSAAPAPQGWPIYQGFEYGTVPSPVVVGSGVVSLDSDSHSGSGALLATSTLAQAQATAGFEFEPLQSGTIYVRAWYKIADTLSGRLNILGLKTIDSLGVESDVVDVNLDGIGANTKVDVYFAVENARDSSTPVTVPMGEWVCIEAAVTISDTVGQAVVRVERLDGGSASYTTQADHDTLLLDGINAVRVGIDWTDPGQAQTEVRVDDLVIDSQPIGCN
jgi:hypothetical protein